MAATVHHINFIVRDLDAAVPVYERVLGMAVTSRDQLADRGVDIARFRLGDTWVVLVQPVREGTGPAHFLAEHGEGFFLLSLGVESIDTQVNRSGLGTRGAARRGLDNWRVQDLDPSATFGAPLQYCEPAPDD